MGEHIDTLPPVTVNEIVIREFPATPDQIEFLRAMKSAVKEGRFGDLRASSNIEVTHE